MYKRFSQITTRCARSDSILFVIGKISLPYLLIMLHRALPTLDLFDKEKFWRRKTLFSRKDDPHYSKPHKEINKKLNGKQTKEDQRSAIGGRDVATSASRWDAHRPPPSHLTISTIPPSLSRHVRRIVSLQDATEIILSESFELRTWLFFKSMNQWELKPVIFFFFKHERHYLLS